MISNNSSGARSVLYGKTIDHVLDLHVALADGSVAHLRPLTAEELDAACAADTFEGNCYRTVRRMAARHAEEIARRYPKILRRVGGYNLDAFTPRRTGTGEPFNLAKLIVGSEGTLGFILEARLNLVPLPKAKAVLTIEYRHLLDALGETPAILAHNPSAVEVMDHSILDHARENPTLDAMRRAVLKTDCGALHVRGALRRLRAGAPAPAQSSGVERPGAGRRRAHLPRHRAGRIRPASGSCASRRSASRWR